MPVITFKYQDLKDLGISMEKDELIDTLPMMSSDIEDFNDEEIKVEFFPNRPDNLSVEGVARSFKGFIGQETGLPKYNVEKSDEIVTVDSEVAEIRPYIAFAKIEREPGTKRTLILKHPNRYIPQFMEDLADIPLVLHMGDKTKTVPIEVANIKSYTLRVKMKNSADIDGIELSTVTSASGMCRTWSVWKVCLPNLNLTATSANGMCPV